VEATHEAGQKKITLQNRLRIDNRFFEVNENESIWSESRYVTRLRYRVQIRLLLNEHKGKNPINLRVANEIMVNTKENVFDQFRLYVTGDFYVNRNFSLETGYIYIYQQRFASQDVFSRHVFRFSVLHRINLIKN
jgi:hypothetical protein